MQTKKPKSTKSSQDIVSVSGMKDVHPKDGEWWRSILDAGHSVADIFDFAYIETPVVENADLFLKSAGGGAGKEQAEKKLFRIDTKEGKLALRSDLSAPVLRSYIEHRLGYFSSPLRVFHYGPVFRNGKLKDGCEREVKQWGFDIVGDNDAVYDVQVMLAAIGMLKQLRFTELKVKINTMGCKVCRNNYRDKLKAYLKKQKLCEDCKETVDVNPMHCFLCEENSCKALRADAPIILDFLCQGCNNHFKSVLEFVEENGISYEPDPYFVREKDYYNRTVFEIVSGNDPLSLAGGGRYDYLAELLFGKTIHGVGVALSLHRVMERMKFKGLHPQKKEKPKAFFIAVGEQAKKMSVRLINELRSAGIPVAEELGKKTLRLQLKAAEKEAGVALIVGQKEAFEGTVMIRNIKTGAQETLIAQKLPEQVKKWLK